MSTCACAHPRQADYSSVQDFDHVEVHLGIYSCTTKGTCNWILSHPDFKEWATGSGDQRTLWLHGLPGGGKTFATSIIVNYLLHDPENIRPDGSSLAYVYCNYDPLYPRLKASDIIRNIVKQIYLYPLTSDPKYQQSSNIIREIRDRNGSPLSKSSCPLSPDECLQYLSSALAETPRTYIIIDALDECVDFDYLIRVLRRVYDLNTNIRFLITSRSLGLNQGKLGEQSCIEVRATERDILQYIQQSINDNTKLEKAISRDPKLESEITKYIVDNARGMFLLPSLWLDRLSKQHSPRQIRNALMSSEFRLPAELFELFAASMRRIQAQQTEDISLALNALTWIVKAQEPLTIAGLTHALGTLEADNQIHEDGVPQAENILSVCAGLVDTHTQPSDFPELRLAHPTLMDFFNKNPQLLHKPELLAQTCLTYLEIALGQFGSPDSEEDYQSWVDNTLAPMEATYPFLRYSCKYWSVQARENYTEPFLKRACQFLCHKPSQARLCILVAGLHVGCVPDLGSAKLPPIDMSPLHAAVLFGAPKLITMLSNISYGFGNFLDATDANGNAPLNWAVFNDRADIVDALLRSSTRANVDHVNSQGKGAVYYSAERASVKALELLPHYYERIDTSRGEYSKGVTPAIIAVKKGHARCLEILIQDFKASMDLPDSMGATPLLHAVQGGHIEIVKLLLDHGANPTYKTTEGETPLYAAILDPQEERRSIISILLEHLNQQKLGAHVQSVLKQAMFVMAKNGNIHVYRNIIWIREHLRNMATPGNPVISVPLLWILDELTDDHGRTPLSHAAERGHEEVTRELFKDMRVSAEIRDKTHWTPLYYATFNGHLNILQLLLHKVRYLNFRGSIDPDDSSDGYADSDTEAWIRGESNKIIKKLSILVASPAFLRPGQSPPISQTPTGIMPCVECLRSSLRPSTRLQLLLKRILHHGVLQTITHHPRHKHELDVEPTWSRHTPEYLKKCPMIHSVEVQGRGREDISEDLDDPMENPENTGTKLAVYLSSRHGVRVSVILDCAPNETVNLDTDKRNSRSHYTTDTYEDL